MCGLKGLFITSPWVSEEKRSGGIGIRGRPLVKNVVGSHPGGACVTPRQGQPLRSPFGGWWRSRTVSSAPPRLLALPSAPPWGTGKENGCAVSGAGWNQFLGPESVFGAIFGSMVALTSDFCRHFPLLPHGPPHRQPLC